MNDFKASQQCHISTKVIKINFDIFSDVLNSINTRVLRSSIPLGEGLVSTSPSFAPEPL